MTPSPATSKNKASATALCSEKPKFLLTVNFEPNSAASETPKASGTSSSLSWIFHARRPAQQSIFQILQSRHSAHRSPTVSRSNVSARTIRWHRRRACKIPLRRSQTTKKKVSISIYFRSFKGDKNSRVSNNCCLLQTFDQGCREKFNQSSRLGSNEFTWTTWQVNI